MVDGGRISSSARGAPGSRAGGSPRASGGAPVRSARRTRWSKSPTSWGTVIVGKVAVSTWCGTRRGSRRRPARGRHGPASRPRRCRRRGRGRRRPARAQRPRRGRSRRPAPPPVTSRVAKRRTSSAAERGSGTSRSSSGRAAHTRTSPASSPTLVHHSLVWGAISSVLATADQQPEHDPSDVPGRHGLGVRDHEEQEDQDLGRGHDDPPEVDPADGRERPVA